MKKYVKKTTKELLKIQSELKKLYPDWYFSIQCELDKDCIIYFDAFVEYQGTFIASSGWYETPTSAARNLLERAKQNKKFQDEKAAREREKGN